MATGDLNMIIRPVINGSVSETSETIFFAASELQKYLTFISDDEFAVVPATQISNDDAVYLFVGAKELPCVENTQLDDAIYINVKGTKGVISGTNERAVLIGVYRYLREIGFSFLQPGKHGEIYPESFSAKDVFVCEKASYRHRTICIEGSVFQQNMMNMIDWLPKVGMSGYFAQFSNPRIFMERWYEQFKSQYRKNAVFTDREYADITELAEREIKKRGLLYHKVGHGWTTLPVGIKHIRWELYEGEIAPEDKELLALVDGERRFFMKMPVATNLCYSNPVARERLVKHVVDYCRENPYVEYLHFWMSDGEKNNCECENCRNIRASDWMVKILNELDKRLTEENLNTKIVFIAYCDFIWAPETERIINPDRFTFGFAPINRSFMKPFDSNEIEETKPYKLNDSQTPVRESEYLGHLREWQNVFNGDSFDFDYHLIYAHYADFGMNFLYDLYRDIKELKNIGLNGYVSCQIQRMFFPTSLGMNILARTLWNRDEAFENIVYDVLSAEFGENYAEVENYLRKLSEYGFMAPLNKQESIVSDKYRNRVAKSFELIEKFVPTVERELAKPNHKKAWEKLKFHTELYKLVLDFYLGFINTGEPASVDDIEEFVKKNELKFKDDFDAMYFYLLFKGRYSEALKESLNK